jgi:hypothetical protein
VTTFEVSQTDLPLTEKYVQINGSSSVQQGYEHRLLGTAEKNHNVNGQQCQHPGVITPPGNSSRISTNYRGPPLSWSHDIRLSLAANEREDVMTCSDDIFYQRQLFLDVQQTQCLKLNTKQLY